MFEIKSADNKKFEEIKHVDENGVEFWLARELQPVLQYAKWERFKDAIMRAKEACQRSKHEINDHFQTLPFEYTSGKGKKDISDDYKMTRYACYLTVMNGDPRKEIIALGQTYFAVKTRQQEYQELFNQLNEEDRRLFLRSDITQKNQLLFNAAKSAGIQTGFEFAEFNDFGYRGLYGGLTAKDIAARKKLDPDKQEILDYMGSSELAANLFRITQTEEVMRRDKVATPQQAKTTHYRVGATVRKTIKELGNTMPEDLPTPERSTKEILHERMNKIRDAEKPKKGKK